MRRRFPDIFRQFLFAAAALAVAIYAAPLTASGSADDPDAEESADSDEAEADEDAPRHRIAPLDDDDVRELTQMKQRMSRAARGLSREVRSPLTVDEALRQIPSPRTPQRIFQWMNANVEFEPYTGSMRGAEGALVTGYANAADQAVLAKALLEAAGHEVQFVTGALPDADAERIVENTRGTAALYTADGSASLDAEQIESPDLSPLFQAVHDHIWLEVDVQGTARGFDPVAAPEYGIAPASAEERHDDLPRDFRADFRMRLVSDLDDGRSLEHLVLDGTMSQVAFHSLTLSFEDDPTRTRGHKPVLTVGDERFEGETIPAEVLERLELQFRYRAGRHEHRWQQVLYRKGQGTDVFRFAHQHFAIAVAPGPISDDKVKQLTASASSDAAEAIGDWIDAERADSVDPAQRRDRANATFDAFGAVFPFAFTRLLDRSTNELARNLGVRAVYDSPRVLTAGLLRDGTDFHLDVQIDGDRIRGVPRSKIPPMAATAFVGLYGMIRDQLTSDILTAYGDHGDTTVRRIFRLVTEQSPRVTTIYSANVDELDGLDIGDSTRDAMRQQVRERDMILLTPTGAVDDSGIERFGWWVLNPYRGNVEGHRADALLAADERSDGDRVDSRSLIEAHLVMLARHYRAAEHATDDEMHFPELACSASSLYRELSRVFCAESEPLPAKDLATCFADHTDDEAGGGGGLVGLTQVDCADLVVPTRCAASYAHSVLAGNLAVADDTTSSPRPGLCR